MLFQGATIPGSRLWPLVKLLRLGLPGSHWWVPLGHSSPELQLFPCEFKAVWLGPIAGLGLSSLWSPGCPQIRGQDFSSPEITDLYVPPDPPPLEPLLCLRFFLLFSAFISPPFINLSLCSFTMSPCVLWDGLALVGCIWACAGHGHFWVFLLRWVAGGPLAKAGHLPALSWDCVGCPRLRLTVPS